MLGFIPTFLHEHDPRPAAQQFQSNYPHGGWDAFPGFTMSPSGKLLYPGDPPMACLYEARFRDEVIRLYQYEWVAIIQPDGSFEVSRMD
jgi:hypothetical protein